MKSFVIFVSLAVYAGLAQAVQGQAADTSVLHPVVVSASKAGSAEAALTQAVTVISGDDLRARGITRVSDALSEVPGATVVQSGSFGSVTSLFLRGGESRYTKVLIDGVAVNAAGGFFDFSHLTTDNIDRIEILRGPASVLYGADAVTGVVQIFTRRARVRNRHHLSARAGTYATRDADADVASGNQRIGGTLGGGVHATKGIVPFNNQYRNGTLSSSLRASSGTLGEAALSARYTAADYHYPQDFFAVPVDSNAHRTQHRLTVGLDAVRSLSSAAQAHVLLGSNDVTDITEDVTTPFGGTSPSHSLATSRGSRRTAEARVAYSLPFAATITTGAEYLVERERSVNSAGAVGTKPLPTDNFSASRHNTAYYAELLGTARDFLSYNLSGRLDDNSDYGGVNTYRAGIGAPLFAGVRVRASLATAFNAPAFNEIHATAFSAGNPDLQPERSRSWEIGVEREWAGNRAHLSADYFNQRFSQLIQYVDGGPPTFVGSFANLTAASSNGIEAEAAIRPLEPVSVTASFTVLQPRVTSVAPSYTGTLQPGDALIRRPSHSGSLGVDYHPSRRSFAVTATYVGKRPDVDFAQFPSPTVTLPAYVKVDLSAQSRILALSAWDELSLTARLENALNRKYYDVVGFPPPGRVVLIGASIDAGH